MIKLKSKTLYGFTLIEMLLTISLFSLMMGALLTGLYAGMKGWGKADSLLLHSTQIRTALQIQIQDLENLYVDPENIQPPITYQNNDADGTKLEFFSLNPNIDSAFPGGITKVIWQSRKSVKGTTWIRIRENWVADQPVGKSQEQTMLSELSRVEYRFYTQGQWLTQWDGNSNIPELIQIRLKGTGAPLSVGWGIASLPLGEGKG